jgi:hypothetical protein
MKALISSIAIVVGAVLLASLPCQAIGGGTPDGSGHPNVGAIGFDLDGPGGPLPPFALCTSFVASDSVVITAAHCIQVAPNASWAVTLEPGPAWNPGVFPDDFPFPIIAPVVYAEEVVTHPRFGEGQFRANDVAVLIFPGGTFADVTPVELPYEHQLDVLAARGRLRRQDFTLVGYGNVPIGRTTGQELVEGFRQYAFAPFQGLTTESLILQLTPEATDEGTTCSGDSGGPQILDGWNLAVSLVGGVPNPTGVPCGTGAVFFQRLDIPVIREFLGQFVQLP